MAKLTEAQRRRKLIARLANVYANDVSSYFDEQKAYVLGRIREFQQKKSEEDQLNQFIFDAAKWGIQMNILESMIDEHVEGVTKKGGVEAYILVGSEESFNVKNPLVGEFIRKFVAEEVKGISKTTRKKVRDVIYQGYDEGLSVNTISKKIASLYDGFKGSRSMMIARTETARAYSQGAIIGYKESKLVKGVEWITAGVDVCPICQANEDQGEVILGSDFQSGHDSPPAHPYCRCSLIPVVIES